MPVKHCLWGKCSSDSLKQAFVWAKPAGVPTASPMSAKLSLFLLKTWRHISHVIDSSKAPPSSPRPHLPLPPPPPPPPPTPHPTPPPSLQLIQFFDPCYVDAQTSGFVGLGINAFPDLRVHYFCVPCCVCWYEHLQINHLSLDSSKQQWRQQKEEGTWNRIKRNKETIWSASCGYPTWFCTKWRAGEKIRNILWIWCVQAKKTEKTEDIDKSLESVDGPVKAIVAHCWVNDIRTKDPKDVSKTMMKLLKRILKDRPNLKVIVSKILPMKDSNLQAKREIFNALVFLFFIFLFFSELVEDPNISFVAH